MANFDALPKDLLIHVGTYIGQHGMCTLSVWALACKRHAALADHIIVRVPMLLHARVSKLCINGELQKCQRLVALAGLRTKWQDMYWVICTRDDMCLWLLTQFQPTITCMLQKIMTTRNVELIKRILEIASTVSGNDKCVNPFYLLASLQHNNYEMCSTMLKYLQLNQVFISATLTCAMEADQDENVRALLENEQYRTFVRTTHIPDWMPTSGIAKRYHRMIMRVKNA